MAGHTMLKVFASFIVLLGVLEVGTISFGSSIVRFEIMIQYYKLMFYNFMLFIFKRALNLHH